MSGLWKDFFAISYFSGSLGIGVPVTGALTSQPVILLTGDTLQARQTSVSSSPAPGGTLSLYPRCTCGHSADPGTGYPSQPPGGRERIPRIPRRPVLSYEKHPVKGYGQFVGCGCGRSWWRKATAVAALGQRLRRCTRVAPAVARCARARHVANPVANLTQLSCHVEFGGGLLAPLPIAHYGTHERPGWWTEDAQSWLAARG